MGRDCEDNGIFANTTNYGGRERGSKKDKRPFYEVWNSGGKIVW